MSFLFSVDMGDLLIDLRLLDVERCTGYKGHTIGGHKIKEK